MRVILAALILALWAGAAAAQRATPILPAPDRPGVVLTADTPAGPVYRVVPVHDLNVIALCAALGGSYIDLRPLSVPNGGAPVINVHTGLNPNAPLAPYLPQGITDIVGIVR